MSILLRSLQFLFLGGMLPVAASLDAQELLTPPRPLTTAAGATPLPLPPRPNGGQLEGVRAIFSGSGTTEPQIGFAEPLQPPQSIQIVQQKTAPAQLTPPNLVSQASFTTHPLPPSVSSPSEKLPYNEELSKDSFPEHDGYEYEPMDLPNEMLDKPLISRKKEKGEIMEREESKTDGWKNKLVKPELSSQLTPLISVAGSLLIVIAAFFLLAILLRKVSPKGNQPLPKEAFECLGRYFLTQKHQLQVLRLGNRIVLVSVMPDGVSTLAEITDPDEVVSFLGLCRRLDTNSATEMFRKTVANMSEDELSRPHERSVGTARRKIPPAASLDLYSDPDESLAAMLERRKYGR